jgi:hypothetical protein
MWYGLPKTKVAWIIIVCGIIYWLLDAFGVFTYLLE